MPRPGKREALIRQARETGTFVRVEIPRTTCDRCHTEQYAGPDGSARFHLRPARPGEELYSADLPTMVECTD
jgi:hypothetical protein